MEAVDGDGTRCCASAEKPAEDTWLCGVDEEALEALPREPAARGGLDFGKPILGADPGALLTRSSKP
jgi:hypothetical protein